MCHLFPYMLKNQYSVSLFLFSKIINSDFHYRNVQYFALVLQIEYLIVGANKYLIVEDYSNTFISSRIIVVASVKVL